MFFPLRAWKETVATFIRERKRQRAKPRALHALRLEALEPRQMMAVLYWDPNHTNGTNLGGSGTWNVTGADWFNPSTCADQAWNNANGDTAVFSGNYGTVTLNSGIQAGELDFSTDAYLLQSGSLAISGSGTIDVGSGLGATISSSLSGSNGLTLTDAGTLLLSGSNTYNGATEVNNGTLQLRSSIALGNSSGVGGYGGLDLDGQQIGSNVSLEGFAGTLTNSSSASAGFGGTIDENDSNSFVVTGNGNITVSGDVNYSTLTMDGDNTLILSGYGGYGGVLNIESGTVQLASTSALAEETTVEASSYGYGGYGGTLDLNGQWLDSSITLENFGGTVTNSNGSSAGIEGSINAGSPTSFTVTGNGSITLSGAVNYYYSTLTMDGDNTLILSGYAGGYGGTLDVESGTLQPVTYLDSSTSLVVNGTLDLQSYSQTVNSLSGNGSITGYGGTVLNVLENYSYTGTIDNVTVEENGSPVGGGGGSGGTLYLTAGETYQLNGAPSDYTTIEGPGTLDLNGQSLDSTISLGEFSGILTNSSWNAAGVAGSVNAYSPESFTVTGNGNITLSGNVNYSYSTLTMDGNDNTLILAGSNGYGGYGGYGGTVNIESGTVQLANSSALAEGTTVEASSNGYGGYGGYGGATLDLDGQWLDSSISLDYFDGTLTNSSWSSAGMAGSINAYSAGSFTVTGNGNITLSGDLNYAYSTLTVDGNNTLILNGYGQGDGGYGGYGGYGGTLNIESGTVQLTNSAVLNDGTFVEVGSNGYGGYGGPTLDLQSNNQTIGALSGNGTIMGYDSGYGGTVLNVLENCSFTGTLENVMLEENGVPVGGDIYIAAGSTFQLNGALWDGSVISGGGTLDLNGQSLESSISLDNFYGILTNSSWNAAGVAGSVNAYSPESFTVTGNGNITLSGDVNYSYSKLTMDGNNTLILAGSNGYGGYGGYGGTVDIESGTVQLASSSALAEGTTIEASSNGYGGYGGYGGATLDLDGQWLDSTISLADFSGTLTDSSWSSAGMAGSVNASSPGSFTVTGNGNITLSGDVNYSYSTLTMDGNNNTLILAGSNGYGGYGGYGGTVDIESGTVQLATSSALAEGTTVEASSNGYGGYGGYGGATLDLDGQWLDSSITLSNFYGTLTNSSGNSAGVAGSIYGDLTVTGYGQITLSGPLSGSLTMAGNNTLVLSGGTDNTGAPLTIDSGTVVLAGAFYDSATLTVNGGTFDLYGNDATIGGLSGYGGVVTNSGSFAYLTINNYQGTANYYGTIEGNLQVLGLDGYGGYGGYGGTLDLDGQADSWDSLYAYDTVTNSSSNAASFAGDGGNYDGTLYVTGTGDITFSGNLTENTLVIDGNNTVILTGSNSFQSVYLESGTLELGSDSAFGEGTTIYGYGGTLDLDGQALDSSITLTDFSATLTNSSWSSASVSGSINANSPTSFTVTGNGNITLSGDVNYSYSTLTMDGNNTLILAGSNGYGGYGCYGGAVNIESGTVQLATSSALAEGTTIEANSGGYGGYGGYGGTLDLDGQWLDSSITLANFAGTLTNSSRTPAGIAGSINADSPTSFTVTGIGGITLSGEVDYGASTLNMDGNNTLILSGYGGYSGTVNIESGTVQLATSSALAEGTTVEASSNGYGGYGGYGGATLDLDGQWLDSSITLSNFYGTLTNSSGNSAGVAGSIYGDLTVTGYGQITLSGPLSGSLTMAGNKLRSCSAEGTRQHREPPLTIDSGTVVLAGAFYDSATLTVNGGTFDLYGNDATIGGLSGYGGVVTNSGSFAYLTINNYQGTANYYGTIEGNLQVLGLDGYGRLRPWLWRHFGSRRPS